jgi:predicted protein tyrosine phosphatase
MRRVLFVCSRNQWRSPTAEAIYRNDSRIDARSAGVSTSAKRRVTAKLLQWADLILVMEPDHKRRLLSQFADLGPELCIRVLDIPDDYAFMDPELMELLRQRTEAILAERDEANPQAASAAFQP